MKDCRDNSDSMECLNDYRLTLGKRQYVPLMVGGMGVDISTHDLALKVAEMGGIGHISDAMLPTVTDRRYKTRFISQKLNNNRASVDSADKTAVKFDIAAVAEATRLHVTHTMERKRGTGAIFINVMEKLGMSAPRETLRVRLREALAAGIDGMTLSAGLHLGSFKLIADAPRFRDVQLGIIVSSVRALKLFLRKSASTGRLPDYVVVEGPLAGGHLGFGMDWAQYDLRVIMREVIDYLQRESLAIPVLPAGGIFTGGEALSFMQQGAAAVQLATRFTISYECGLPSSVKQKYLGAESEDVVVNQISPTGYPMRMLSQSPAIGAGVRPNCETLGYLLDGNGRCAYVDAYYREKARLNGNGGKIVVHDKTCLCTHMHKFNCWTCGSNVSRLKETTHLQADGRYQLLTADHICNDYLFSRGDAIALPPLEEDLPSTAGNKRA